MFIMIKFTNAHNTLKSKFGSNMDKPKWWVKNEIKNYTVESES